MRVAIGEQPPTKSNKTLRQQWEEGQGVGGFGANQHVYSVELVPEVRSESKAYLRVEKLRSDANSARRDAFSQLIESCREGAFYHLCFLLCLPFPFSPQANPPSFFSPPSQSLLLSTALASWNGNLNWSRTNHYTTLCSLDGGCFTVGSLLKSLICLKAWRIWVRFLHLF